MARFMLTVSATGGSLAINIDRIQYVEPSPSGGQRTIVWFSTGASDSDPYGGSLHIGEEYSSFVKKLIQRSEQL